MEYRSLAGSSLECLHEAFLAVFRDYSVPMNMSFPSFVGHLARNGFQGDVSAGAFDQGRLVGFVLNGVRSWEGEKTIYDAGTGVLPAYRGAGVASGLMALVNQLCMEHEIRMYQLEVIKDNLEAINLYKKQGFQVKRSLISHVLKEKQDISPACGTWRLQRVKGMDAQKWALAKSFWEYAPSWQNGIDAVCSLGDDFAYTLAEGEGALIGYGIVDGSNGDIAQLAVAREQRGNGIAAAILHDLQIQAHGSRMTVINVDQRDEKLNGFLHRMGFQPFTSQYEMIKSI